MDDRVMQFRVGVMVLASVLIVGILMLLLGELELPRFLRRTDTVRLWFPEGRGVSEGALVRRNGIVVGRVMEVRFVGDQDLERPQGVDEAEFTSGILVAAEIQDDVKLYKHDTCRIQTDLLGKPSLHFFRPEDQLASKELLDLAKLQKGKIASDPLDSLSVVTQTLSDLTPKVNAASDALVSAGSKMGAAFENVNKILDERTRENIQDAAAEMKMALHKIQDILGDDKTRGDLAKAIEQLPVTLDKMNRSMTRIEQSLNKFVEPQRPGEPSSADKIVNVIDGVDKAVGKLTKPPAPGEPAPVDRLANSIHRFEGTMEQINLFAQKLNQPDSALGQLVNDPKTAQDIRQLIAKLKPILDDVRVFTDKVARHPERVGVRGALQRYPGIK